MVTPYDICILPDVTVSLVSMTRVRVSQESYYYENKPFLALELKLDNFDSVPTQWLYIICSEQSVSFYRCSGRFTASYGEFCMIDIMTAYDDRFVLASDIIRDYANPQPSAARNYLISAIFDQLWKYLLFRNIQGSGVRTVLAKLDSGEVPAFQIFVEYYLMQYANNAPSCNLTAENTLYFGFSSMRSRPYGTINTWNKYAPGRVPVFHNVRVLTDGNNTHSVVRRTISANMTSENNVPSKEQ